MSLVARVGTAFEVNLEEPVGTGYRWLPDALPIGLSLIDEERRQAGQTGAGGGALHVFRLEAAAVGEYAVHFALKRAWVTVPARVEVINVRVQS